MYKMYEFDTLSDFKNMILRQFASLHLNKKVNNTVNHEYTGTGKVKCPSQNVCKLCYLIVMNICPILRHFFLMLMLLLPKTCYWRQ